MFFVFFLRLLILFSFVFSNIHPTLADVRVRIKDIVSVEGVRGNQLVGYGLVVGLNGSGDTIGSTTFTRESLASMLERLGVNVRDNTGAALLNGKNVAAVMVTATLPPFARQGSKIDVNVSALGDAKDLRGGTLLVTPLLAADGQVYAVGQGSVAVGGFKAEGQAASVTKGVPTSGRISSGAIVEKEIGFELASMNHLKFNLNNPDFTTAKRIADRINHTLGNGVAKAEDPSTVQTSIPDSYRGRTVEFMTLVEQLEIEPDQVAKIVIDDHDGVIVMGQHVRISPVAISHGSITIKVTENPEAIQPTNIVQANTTALNANATFGINDQNQSTSQTNTPTTNTVTGNPITTTTNTTTNNNSATNNTTTNQAAQPSNITKSNTGILNVAPGSQNSATFGPGGTSFVAPGIGTAVVARTDIKVTEEKGKMAVLESGVTLQQLVDGLNALGATPRDMIIILQSIKASGALQAEIEVI